LALIIWMTGVSRTLTAEVPSPAVASTNGSNTAAAFSSAVEALGMMIQVVGSLEEKVRGKDLTSIHSEDLVLNESLAGILQQADSMETARRASFRADVTKFGQAVAALHFAGDTQQFDLATKQLSLVGETFDRIKAYFPKTTLDSAQEAASQYLCPAHRDIRGKRTEFCPKCGAALDQQVRLLPAFCSFGLPTKQSIRASIRTDHPLIQDKPVTAFLKLSRADGSLVYPSDLITTHTEKVHLLIIDSSLSDYHHEHPHLAGVSGEYAFSFTPRKPGSYLVWADLRPQPIGLQQFATTTIPATTIGEPLTNRIVTNRAIVDGLNFELTFATDILRVERPIPGRLRISQADGTPFAKLEPIMASFAHLVGFNEDGKTVLHIHPKGLPVLDPATRGGPELEFQLYTLKPGFVRLFAQVQIDGRSRFAPFGIRLVR
jgi:hypothetical protein